MTKNEKTLLFFFLLISISIRFFSDTPYCFISMDGPKYLALARNLPHYILFNKNFYVGHPPFYPLLIKIFSYFFPDHIAGLLISQISATGLILICTFFLYRFGTKIEILYFFVLFSGLSYLLYYWSNMIYKELLFTFLFYLTIFSLIQTFTYKKRVWLISSCLSAFFLSITSDFVIFAIPVILFLTYLFGRGNLRYKLLPFFVLISGYSSWILIRIWIYSNNVYYPAGVDGLVENVSSWNIINAITPRSFYWTKIFTDSNLSFNLNHYVKYFSAFVNLISPFHISITKTGIKEILLIIFIYLPILFFLFSGIYFSFRKIDKKSILMFLIMLSFFIPSIFEISNPRFSLPSSIPVFYFISSGIVRFFDEKKNIKFFLSTFLIIFFVFWLIKNPYFFLFKKKIIQIEKTCKILNSLPQDGIMAQFGFPPEIAYLTDKKVICLPLTPEELEYQIQLYNIHYLIISENPEFYEDIYYYITQNSKYIKIKNIKEKLNLHSPPTTLNIYKITE